MYLTACIGTGAYTKGIRFWELAPRTVESGQSENPGSERHVAYTICRVLGTVGSRAARDSLWDVVRPFLERNVPIWLGNGLCKFAARWMKIAFCDLQEPPLSPKE